MGGACLAVTYGTEVVGCSSRVVVIRVTIQVILASDVVVVFTVVRVCHLLLYFATTFSSLIPIAAELLS